MKTGDNVKIRGIDYKIHDLITPEIAEGKGLVNTAKLMRKNQSYQLYLQRPKGAKIYFAVGSSRYGLDERQSVVGLPG